MKKMTTDRMKAALLSAVMAVVLVLIATLLVGDPVTLWWALPLAAVIGFSTEYWVWWPTFQRSK